MQKVECMSKKSVTGEDFVNLYKYNFLIPQKSLQKGLQRENQKWFELQGFHMTTVTCRLGLH